MFVNNYWSFLISCQEISSAYRSNPGPLRTSYGCVGTDGNAAQVTYSGYVERPYTSDIFADINLRPYTYLTLGIGSGTTDPDFHDYNLESDLSSSFSDLKSSVVLGADKDHLKIVGTVSGINSSGSDVTISEIGLFKGYSTSVHNGSRPIYTPDAKVLYARELLETPIVVKARTGFNLTYEFTIR